MFSVCLFVCLFVCFFVHKLYMQTYHVNFPCVCVCVSGCVRACVRACIKGPFNCQQTQPGSTRGFCSSRLELFPLSLSLSFSLSRFWSPIPALSLACENRRILRLLLCAAELAENPPNWRKIRLFSQATLTPAEFQTVTSALHEDR